MEQEIFYTVAEQVVVNSKNCNASSFIVGLNGAQGSGKTTVSRILQQILQQDFKLRTVVLSLDDFYKTKAARQQMADMIHPLFITRGVPGSHDVSLLISAINRLKSHYPTKIPIFSKAIDDRLPESEWPTVNGKVDIVILEGWCVGAKPQTAAELIEAINSLEAKEDSEAIWRTCSNNVLAIGYQKLFGLLDMLIMLKVTDFSLVHQHRLQQEEELARKTNHPAMNKSEIARFVAHYQRLTEAILKEMPARADLVLEVDAAHSYTLRD